MTSDVQAACALTADRRAKGKHVCAARCRRQEREAGTSACEESADDACLSDVPAESDSRVTELLQFVNLISSDIKVTLGRSPRSKRHVDHRKYLQRQLTRLTSVPSDSFVLQCISPPENERVPSQYQTVTEPENENCSLSEQKWQTSVEKCYKKDELFDEVNTYEDIKQNAEQCWERTKMLKNSRDIETTESSSTNSQNINVEVSSGVKITSENCTDQTLKKKDMLHSLEGHFQRQSSKVKHMYSPANCYMAGAFCSGETFQKQDIPLRQRHLPASFWQEPNVPRFHFDNAYFHGLCFNWQEQTQSYKAFVERLQTAHRHRIDNFSSQYPITDFLYHKYGMKDTLSSHPYSDFLPLYQHYSTDVKPMATYPTGSTTPHVHPYVDSVFPGAPPELPNRSWDFVLGKLPPGFDMFHPVCKPVATKTSHTNRYHPFRDSP